MLKSKFEGITRVFVKEFDGKLVYSTQLSQKNVGGEWEHIYINLRFKKGIIIADKTDINVKNGWLTFYKTENGLPRYSIFINEYEIANGEQQERAAIEEEEIASGDMIDDLPF